MTPSDVADPEPGRFHANEGCVELSQASKTLLAPFSTGPSEEEVDSADDNNSIATTSMAVVAGCVAFTEGFAATAIFPFLVDLTKDLLGDGIPVEMYSGLLYSVNYTGMLLMQYPWMRLSDVVGRRRCLLVSVFLSLVCTVLAAFTANYWGMVVLRFALGMVNASNTLARTSLREAFQFHGDDETWAFSQVSVAFAVSALLGPSLGGVLYGQALSPSPGHLSWTLPWLAVSLLYAVCLLVVFCFHSETAFLQREARTAKGKMLCGDTNFALVLAMAWAHSYIFIGWETTYAAFAQLPSEKMGMDWSPKRVGTTFLVGGVAMMAFSSCLYPRMVQKFTAIRVFTFSWFFSLVVLLLFPRGLTYIISHGVESRSFGVVSVNYAAQVMISTLLGSGFTSIQLIMNKYVAALPDSGSQLASANGAMASAQALARAMAPAFSGALLSAGMESSFLSRATTFDAMALLSVVMCLLSSRF